MMYEMERQTWLERTRFLGIFDIYLFINKILIASDKNGAVGRRIFLIL